MLIIITYSSESNLWMLFDGESLVPSPASASIFMFPSVMGDFGEVGSYMLVQKQRLAVAFVVDLETDLQEKERYHIKIETYQGEFKASHVCEFDGVGFFAGTAVDRGFNLERYQSSKFFSELAIQLHLDPVHQLYNPLKREVKVQAFLGKAQLT